MPPDSANLLLTRPRECKQTTTTQSHRYFQLGKRKLYSKPQQAPRCPGNLGEAKIMNFRLTSGITSYLPYGPRQVRLSVPQFPHVCSGDKACSPPGVLTGLKRA